jgi:hypothetical protein
MRASRTPPPDGVVNEADRDGTILSMKSFPNPEEGLEAVGLRE